MLFEKYFFLVSFFHSVVHICDILLAYFCIIHECVHRMFLFDKLHLLQVITGSPMIIVRVCVNKMCLEIFVMHMFHIQETHLSHTDHTISNKINGSMPIHPSHVTMGVYHAWAGTFCPLLYEIVALQNYGSSYMINIGQKILTVCTCHVSIIFQHLPCLTVMFESTTFTC